MVGEVVLLQVAKHVPVCPVGNRVDLPALAAGNTLTIEMGSEVRHVRPPRGLRPAQPGKPAAHADVAQGSFHGLDLVFPVIDLDAGETLLPTLAVTGFLPGRALGVPVGLQIQVQPV